MPERITEAQEVVRLSLMMLIAIFGSITATLMKHEGEGLTLKQLIKIALYKSFIGCFAGLMAGFLAGYLKFGLYESFALAGMAGLAGKEFLDLVKKKFKQKAEAAL